MWLVSLLCLLLPFAMKRLLLLLVLPFSLASSVDPTGEEPQSSPPAVAAEVADAALKKALGKLVAAGEDHGRGSLQPNRFDQWALANKNTSKPLFNLLN